MEAETDAHETSDEVFLDQAFDRLVARLEQGSSPEVGELVAGREHLRAEVERLLRTARQVTPIRFESLPKVPGYMLLGELGRGGMGVVYLAKQDTLGGRRVALKLLPAAACASQRARTRFLAEARTIASLRHAHVVTIHDVVAQDDVHAYAMEWVDGASLAALLQFLKSRRDDLEQTESAGPGMDEVREFLGTPELASTSYPVFVCKIGIAIARALSALHEAGLVHRDVKPSNILLRRDGTPLLSDFGLAHETDGELTHGGQFVGTLAYASPEQLAGGRESLDARSDVYALGVTLYHALTLHLPFDNSKEGGRKPSTPTAMLSLIERGRGAPLRTWNRSLPRDLDTILAKAIDPNPSRRYARAAELVDDLERMLSLQPILARRSGLLARSVKLVRRNRSAALGIGTGSIVSLAIAAAAMFHVFRVPLWIADHVRQARLALLDPGQANAIFTSEFLSTPERNSPMNLRIPLEDLDVALEHYDAALRWGGVDELLQKERDVIRAARHGSTNSLLVDADDHRTAGLRSYMSGDVDGALDHWEQLERAQGMEAAPDPLVEAAMGILYLVREQPARAYTRLREACRLLPDVGYLTTYLADAALRCGDLDVAQNLVLAASSMAHADPMGALERVRADLLAARGCDVEAEEIYLRGTPVSPTRFHYVQFLISRGRAEEAMDLCTSVAESAQGGRFHGEFARALESWWQQLSASERLQRVAATLSEDPGQPSSLVYRLRLYRSCGTGNAATELGPPHALARLPRSRDPGVFLAFAPASSSPPPQRLELEALAESLEVEDMARWREIHRYPSSLKLLQLCAWYSPFPQSFSASVNRLYHRFWPSLASTRALAAVAGVALIGATANAQDCPPVRYSFGIAYDSQRAVTMLYGGWDGTQRRSETWEWDGSSWALRSAGNPAGRTNLTSLSYDRARGVTVLFGGSFSTGNFSNETWEWNGTVWSLRSTAGPTGREAHMMAYDSARGVTVMFSGLAYAGLYQNIETWEWDGNQWTLRTPATSPPPRVAGAMAYDEARGVCVLFGGAYAPTGTSLNDTWEWDGVNWTQRFPAHVPTARLDFVLVYDSNRSRSVLYGGSTYTAGIPFTDTWEWNGADWTQVANGPPRQYLHGAFDSARGKVVIFGGHDGTAIVGDTWEYDGAHVEWRRVAVGPNSDPVANAGDDQSGPEGASIALDGSRSLSCGPRTYSWTQIAGPSVTLDMMDPARPTFTAPLVPIGGATLTFELTVSDASRTSAPDVVNVVVSNVNHPPVALAGDDQIVAEGSPVQLDGSNSFDPDDDPLSYTWSQVGGPAVALDFTNPIRPTFTAPLVGAAGDTLVFQLTLSDTLDSASDSVSVHVDNVNHLPTADAGADQTRAEGVLVTLDASASQDPDSDTLSYAWSQIGGPAVALANANTSAPSFTAPQVGAPGALLVFRVNVDDGYGGTAFDDVQINVQDSNAGPSCALARSSVAEIWPPNHKLVAISILGVTDPENDAITIRYLGVTQDEPISGLGDGDTGPDAVIQGSALLLRAERSGTGNGRVYRVTFEAEDGHGGVCSGTVKVCVPHSKSKNAPAPVDDGQTYNSLGQ